MSAVFPGYTSPFVINRDLKRLYKRSSKIIMMMKKIIIVKNN